MPISAEMLAKYKSGEPLTDGELSELCHYYNGLRRALDGFTPPEYRLFKTHVSQEFERCSDMRTARTAFALKQSLRPKPTSS